MNKELKKAIKQGKDLTYQEREQHLNTVIGGSREMDVSYEDLFVGLILLGEKQRLQPEINIDDWEVDVAKAIFDH